MKVTNKIKALSTMTLAAATLFLAGCQAQSNTLTFTPQSPTASMNINQSAVVTVNTRDSRPQQEIATYTKSGELIKLNASPSVTQLFQQVMQQNLVSKGFRIGQANNANAGVTVEVNTLNSKIQAVVYVQGPRGQYNKTFNATRSQSGAFNASNDEIQKVLGETFKDIVNNIYQDQEVTNAINQYTN